jgi:hypothetical protein
MIHRVRSVLGVALAAGATLLVLAGPAGAQQLVDAGKEGDGSGGLAFVLMAVTVFIMAGALFFMDHVRRNRLPQDEDAPK